MNKKFSIILAVDEKNGLGKNWDLAWRLSSDLKYFRKITTETTDWNKKNAIVMWRKTWESIPEKFRPLPNRINYILSRKVNTENQENVFWSTSIGDCLEEVNQNDKIENIFIIWWARLYNDTINHPLLERVYITKVKWDFDCDVFFNGIPENFKIQSKSEVMKENDIEFSFEVWRKYKFVFFMLKFLKKIKFKFLPLILFLWFSIITKDNSENHLNIETFYFTINNLSSILLLIWISSFLILNSIDIKKERKKSVIILEYFLPLPIIIFLLLNSILITTLTVLLLFLVDNIVFNLSKQNDSLLFFNIIYILVSTIIINEILSSSYLWLMGFELLIVFILVIIFFIYIKILNNYSFNRKKSILEKN